MVATASFIPVCSSSKLAGRGGTKLCINRIPTQKSPAVLNQEIVVASYRSTTSNPSNHRAIEVGSNLATEVRGAPSR